MYLFLFRVPRYRKGFSIFSSKLLGVGLTTISTFLPFTMDGQTTIPFIAQARIRKLLFKSDTVTPNLSFSTSTSSGNPHSPGQTCDICYISRTSSQELSRRSHHSTLHGSSLSFELRQPLLFSHPLSSSILLYNSKVLLLIHRCGVQ